MKTGKRFLAGIFCLLMVVICVVGLTSCESKCDHKWSDWKATAETSCTEPTEKQRTCSLCDEVEKKTFDAEGHKWKSATCESAKTCTVCKATEGEALGHTWTDATCEAAKTCSVCKKTEGEALTLASEVPTRACYAFQGWATSADGEVAYAAGAEYTADEDITLYAVWALAIDTSNRTLPEGAEVKAEGWVLDKVDGAVKETQVKWEIYALGEEIVLNFTLWPEETDKVATTTLAAVNPADGGGIGYATFGKQSWAGDYRHKVTKVVIGDGIAVGINKTTFTPIYTLSL